MSFHEFKIHTSNYWAVVDSYKYIRYESNFLSWNNLKVFRENTGVYKSENYGL